MLNASQVKFLRNLDTMRQNWLMDNPNEDLENAMSAWSNETGIRPTFHPLGRYREAYYSVTGSDLARVGQMDPYDVP